MRAWAWFLSTWTLRLLKRRFSSNIYIVSRLLEMASFITQHISLSFVALAKDVERSQLALLFSLFPYSILKVLYTEPISSTHLTRGGLGVSSMFILLSSIKSWYHGLSGFSMLPEKSLVTVGFIQLGNHLLIPPSPLERFIFIILSPEAQFVRAF